MRITQWKIVPALVAGVTMIGGCQTNGPTRGSGPPQFVKAESAVHAPGTCDRDRWREPRNFLVTIHVGPPGTPLLKEGSRVIAPGEVPVFRVLRSAATPPGKILISYIGQVDAYGNTIVDDRGRHIKETPFVTDNGKVYDFSVDEADETRNRWPRDPRAKMAVDDAGEPDEMGDWRYGVPRAITGVRARTMCDEVCTFERPCKYSIKYVPETVDTYPELDPYTIIH